jgi:formamidopyrimidine-DNA glycosylase
MPELPEVETIRRDLLRRVRGRTITGVDFPPDPRGCRLLRRYPSRAAFSRRLRGRRILDLRRRGKYLLFILESGEILIVHLGMSGCLVFSRTGGTAPSHLRAVLRLRGGGALRYTDPRKFGEFYLFSSSRGETAVNPFLLGPEPLEKGFSSDRLKRVLEERRAPIKAVLLDQKAVAGLGNIYTDEALFRAGLHPRRPSDRVKAVGVRKLRRAIRAVLSEAIRARGTTAEDGGYRDGAGRAGSFQFRLRVYQRKGRPCPRCRTPIATAKIAGRTAHFCPRCQK